MYTGTQFSTFWRISFRTFSASFSKPVPETPQDIQNMKTMKNHSQNGGGGRDRRVLESPFGVFEFQWWFQNRFFMHPGAFEAAKQHQNGAKTMKKTSNTMQWTSKATLFSWPCGRKRKHICACHFLHSTSVPVFQSIFFRPPGDGKRIEYIYIYIHYILPKEKAIRQKNA